MAIRAEDFRWTPNLSEESYCKALTMESRGSQLILAAYENDYHRFYAVLGSGPISDEDIGKALVAVAYKSAARMHQVLTTSDAKASLFHERNIEMLSSLLSRDSISTEARSQALFASVLCRNVEMAHMLIESGQIDPRYLKEAIHENHRGAQDIETAMERVRDRIQAKL